MTHFPTYLVCPPGDCTRKKWLTAHNQILAIGIYNQISLMSKNQQLIKYFLRVMLVWTLSIIIPEGDKRPRRQLRFSQF